LPGALLVEEAAVMNPVLGFFCTCFLILMMIPVTFFLITGIYRWSCVLCGVPKPNVIVAAGIMFVGWLSFVMAVSVVREGIHAATAAAGLPRWESSIIVFLLALPIDLVISAGIESSLMGVRFGKGVEIWYTQRLIQLTLIATIGFVVGIIVLIQQLS
jgi:hypothetical protein